MTTIASSVSDAQTVASHIDDARVVIYNCNLFIIQATGLWDRIVNTLFSSKLTNGLNNQVCLKAFKNCL